MQMEKRQLNTWILIFLVTLLASMRFSTAQCRALHQTRLCTCSRCVSIMAGAPAQQILALRPGNPDDDKKADAVLDGFFAYLNGKSEINNYDERFADALSEYMELKRTEKGTRTLNEILQSRKGRPPRYPTKKRAGRGRARRRTYRRKNKSY